MTLDKALTKERLLALWESQDVPVLDTAGEKLAILSDVHLGDGGSADDLVENEETFLCALDHYLEGDYKVILLGDIEELWQFDLGNITARYWDTVYTRMRAFGPSRLFRVFGNHDSEWGGLVDPATGVSARPAYAPEAIKLRDVRGDVSFLLVHGHQGSIDSDKGSWFARFFVRLFRYVEPFAKLTGLYGHGSATKSQVTKDYERIMYGWAKGARVILICGHSHRAIFASRSYADTLRDQIAELKAEIIANPTKLQLIIENTKKIDRLERMWEEESDRGRDIDPTEENREPLPCYFNSGCALYSSGITALEIEDDEIRLVKWHRDATEVPRFVIYNRGKVGEFVDQVRG
jgi:UDP-2,3-diacylglucosamine pyrophosphatase LpxH